MKKVNQYSGVTLGTLFILMGISSLILILLILTNNKTGVTMTQYIVAWTKGLK